jgi:protoporphyrinogen oxidase
MGAGVSSASPGASSQRVTILGGGVAGLYAGRVLAEAGREVTVLEKAPRVGGSATSLDWNGNSYDLGVHYLHAHDPEILRDLQALTAGGLRPVEKSCKIRFGRGYRDYPLKFRDLLTGIPPSTLFVAVTGLTWQQILNRLLKRESQNAEQALVHLYGRPLYDLFFREFTQSYWGFPPTLLSAEFVRAKMPRLSAVDAAREALVRLGLSRARPPEIDDALAPETLYYSARGSQEIPLALADFIRRSGGRVLTDTPVAAIQTEGKRVREIRYSQDGQDISLPCDACISTIPLPDLCRAVRPSAHSDTLTAASAIRYKPLAVFGFLVKRRPLLPALFVHFRDRIYHRASEPALGGLAVQPETHTTLLVEMTCDVGDDRWKGDDQVLEAVIRHLEMDGILSRDQIVESHHAVYEHAYPIYALGFEKKLEQVRHFLAGFRNLQSTGALGAFTYPRMHGAMRMGAEAAGMVLNRNP